MMARHLNIELEYEASDDKNDLALDKAVEPGSDVGFDVLPAQLRADLHHAAMMLDTEELRSLCNAVNEVDGNAAQQLEALIDDFELESIIELTAEHDL